MYSVGGLSDVIETDTDSMPRSSASFKHPSDHEYPMMQQLVSSASNPNYNQNQNQNQNESHVHNDHRGSNIGGQTESSLTRYRSAPSSFFANILEDDDFLDSEFFSPHQQQQQKFQPKSCELKQYDSPQMPHLHTSNSNNNSNSNIIYNHNNNLGGSSTFGSMNSTSSNLIRQSSSPAGFLSSLKSESGFVGMRDVEKTISSNRLNNNISFSPGLSSSSSMFLPQIPENMNQTNDSTFKSLKRTRDGDSITLERQDGLSGHSLVHHLSLPKTSSEMALAEKFLRFEQDLVPTKSRAKRGCATHPRSIAERVRRTRISNRMKKLQELFPNMDKQTSIADMLDMAVQHIKDLQKDLETLRDARSKCECSSKQ